MVYKALHGIASEYIVDLFTKVSDIHRVTVERFVQ